MAEQKIAPKQLVMTSVPEQPVRPAVYGAGAAKKRLVFKFNRLIRQTVVMAAILAMSLGCYFVISHFFLESVQVVGVSMVPTLAENNHYLLNRWAFHNREPKAGDIVVIRDPADHGYSVKRIVATGGQSILFKWGIVYLNGKQLKEPYLVPNTPTYTYAHATQQMINCGKDEYFVMGDNRPRSIDSRVYGPVKRADIMGLVVLR
jgi:signal peptidase I